MENNVPPPRVIIFPLPAQGHVTPMLNLAELLSLSGVHVTFLVTDHVHERLLRHGAAAANPGLVFRTFTGSRPCSADKMAELLNSITTAAQPLLKQMLASEAVTCIIADGIFGNFIVDVGDEFDIPVITFRTTSASYLWACFSIPHIIQARELPIRGYEHRNRIIKSVGGMESFLRCRDFPNFGPLSDSEESILQLMAEVTHQSSRAAGVILNTFDDLEGPIVSRIRAHCNPKTYTVGPLHARRDRSHSNSLFRVDRACMTWLDSQPSGSVVYVCFGSLAAVTKDQLTEFWHGLVNSGKRFLWAIRPDLLAGGELAGATPERGFVAEWVPQEEVLNHRAVGGFLTHSGWNSTLESIVAGVPMICWPYFGDQQINSRYVGEVWKLGIDMKDVCDRRVIEKMVNDLMVERRDEFARSAAEMAGLAKTSVSQGGSSYCNFNTLVHDIKLMRK